MNLRRIFSLPAVMAALYGGSGLSSTFEISGTATFEATTTVPGVEVKGVSNSISGKVTIGRDDRGLAMEHVEVAIPVKSLATGMKVRDAHMRKYIFTDDNAQMPDIRFMADSIFCTASQSAQEFPCQVGGTLAIRGATHPFSMKLSVRQQSAAHPVFRAAGDATLKLSDFGIARPSQFGVSTSDEVKLHLDFWAKQGVPPTTAAGGER
jgi:polyisoprenoid-binding protein YceI